MLEIKDRQRKRHNADQRMKQRHNENNPPPTTVSQSVTSGRMFRAPELECRSDNNCTRTPPHGKMNLHVPRDSTSRLSQMSNIVMSPSTFQDKDQTFNFHQGDTSPPNQYRNF